MTMTADEIRKHVDVIIENTFNRLRYAYLRSTKPYESEELKKLEKEGHFTRLIFPRYRKGELRISEQELRFVFTEVFTQYCDATKHPEVKAWHYSIETPTLDTYFFKKGQKASKSPFPRQDKHGESANFDFVIHDKKLKRICLIEFKAHKKDTIHKDYVKLIYDLKRDNDIKINRYSADTQCYFIEIVENHDNGTLKKFHNELNRIKETEKSDNFDNIIFCCYSLNGKNITDEIITFNTSNQ